MTGFELGATKITDDRGRCSPYDPDAAPRDLLRRVADDLPYVRLDGESVHLVDPVGIFADVIADELRPRRLGADDDAPVAIAIPGWWPGTAVTAVRAALRDRGVAAVLVNDAEAAVSEALRRGYRLSDDVAVVSLRAALVSTVIVSNCHARPRALPTPTLVHDESGDSLDATVLQHLARGLCDLGEPIELDDPRTIAAARASLASSRAVREALSTSVREPVPPGLFDVERRVLLVRSELEELATPWADDVVEMVRTALEQHAGGVGAVLLTGGLATMPLIGQRMSADLGLEVHVPDEPGLVVARGAELLLAERRSPGGRREPLWRTMIQRITRRQTPPEPREQAAAATVERPGAAEALTPPASAVERAVPDRVPVESSRQIVPDLSSDASPNRPRALVRR